VLSFLSSATEPPGVDEMKFQHRRVPGEEKVDLDGMLGTVPSRNRRSAIGG
jgi:hypothetical protein